MNNSDSERDRQARLAAGIMLGLQQPIERRTRERPVVEHRAFFDEPEIEHIEYARPPSYEEATRGTTGQSGARQQVAQAPVAAEQGQVQGERREQGEGQEQGQPAGSTNQSTYIGSTAREEYIPLTRFDRQAPAQREPQQQSAPRSTDTSVSRPSSALDFSTYHIEYAEKVDLRR